MPCSQTRKRSARSPSTTWPRPGSSTARHSGSVSEQHGLLTLNLAGGHGLRVYQKPGHTPAAYTILMFQVDDIEATVGELTRRDVQFERYDGMEQDELGITRGGGPFIAAWFKDPAGNLLEVLQER